LADAQDLGSPADVAEFGHRLEVAQRSGVHRDSNP
jgi:hypothetical protein